MWHESYWELSTSSSSSDCARLPLVRSRNQVSTATPGDFDKNNFSKGSHNCILFYFILIFTNTL